MASAGDIIHPGTMKDDVIAVGGAALGARLRRLSAAIDADAVRVYALRGVRFEQRWFGVVDQLARNGPMTVGALAEALGISHPSVSETRRSLESAGYVDSAPDAADSRRRTIALTETGKGLVADLEPVWEAFDAAARALDEEAGAVTAALTRLDEALARRPLMSRVMDELARRMPDGDTTDIHA